jgi:UDP-N-acetylmuramate--alanine ligase
MLAELGRLKDGVLVAGAHGKTTTTSLISTIFAYGGLDPTVIIGGRLKATGSNARLGQGAFLVAEADESDGSFLKLSPIIAVITNIDREHMDFFKTLEALKDAFLSFANKIPFYGTAVVCIENKHVRDLIPFIHRRYITYGLTPDAHLYAQDIRKGFMSISFTVMYQGKDLGVFEIPIAGEHNVLNCLAAIGVALILKMDVGVVREALKEFSGVQRRLEFKGEAHGIQIYDDYGHHPIELQVTLKAVKEGISLDRQQQRRLVVIFQPHRYSRTRDLIDEFSISFSDADVLVVLDIYPAGEKTEEGVTSAKLVEKIKSAGHSNVLYIKDKETAITHLVSHLKQGDICLTLGAGDVWKMGEEILKRLQVNR